MERPDRLPIGFWDEPPTPGEPILLHQPLTAFSPRTIPWDQLYVSYCEDYEFGQCSSFERPDDGETSADRPSSPETFHAPRVPVMVPMMGDVRVDESALNDVEIDEAIFACPLRGCKHCYRSHCSFTTNYSCFSP